MTTNSYIAKGTNYHNIYQSLSSKQRQILAIAPKCTSPLSIIGCLYVICKILRQDRSSATLVGQNSRTYTNLLLGLSVADLITSIAYFLSTWPIPKDTVDTDYIWYNVGTQTTCSIQGLMFQIGILGSLMYTCSLSLHFLLSIRYKWLPSRVKKLDPFIHAVSILIPIGTGILGWFKTVYNPTSFVCYLQGYPNGCLKIGGCIRGSQTRLYMLCMIIFPILLAFIFISTAMTLIYLTVYHQDQRMSRYQQGANNIHRMTRQTFWMACQYVGAFCVSFLPLALLYFVKLITKGEVPFLCLFWQALLSPLQGFLNAVVYSNDLGSHLHSVRQSVACGLRNVRRSLSQSLIESSATRNNDTTTERVENEVPSISATFTVNQENSNDEESVNENLDHGVRFEDESAINEQDESEIAPMLKQSEETAMEMHEMDDIITMQDSVEPNNTASLASRET